MFYGCPKLQPGGRCGIYETRPMLCRTYQAGSDRLCAMYVAPKVDDPQNLHTNRVDDSADLH